MSEAVGLAPLWPAPPEGRERAAGQLAPPPDFRYVGLYPGPRLRLGILAGTLGACASLGASLCHAPVGRGALFSIAAASVAIVFAGLGGPRVPRNGRQDGPDGFEMAIVPWGILVESDHATRVLRWAAIKRVQLRMIHGSDLGTPTTRWSLVTVDALHERFSGRTAGAVSLDRLMVYLGAYADEASHRVALDLEGTSAGEGPTEPDCESLLMTARTWIATAEASHLLDLPASGYRSPAVRATSKGAIEVLGAVLRDRTAREIDPRPFAAVVAAELHAVELVDELVALVQSPHPIIAAVAKVAAHKLGVPTSRVGALDEVSPFLLGRDAEALKAWASAR